MDIYQKSDQNNAQSLATCPKRLDIFPKCDQKVSKICPKFGDFFKMCPRSCQRLGHYVEIFQHGESQTYPNFTALRMLTLWHSMSATTPSRCLPPLCLFQSWYNSECPADLVPRGDVQGGPQHSTPASRAPTTFTVTHILLSVASLTCSEQVARHSDSSKDIKAFNMISNSRRVAKFLGDNMMCQWCAIIHG